MKCAAFDSKLDALGNVTGLLIGRRLHCHVKKGSAKQAQLSDCLHENREWLSSFIDSALSLESRLQVAAYRPQQRNNTLLRASGCQKLCIVNIRSCTLRPQPAVHLLAVACQLTDTDRRTSGTAGPGPSLVQCLSVLRSSTPAMMLLERRAPNCLYTTASTLASMLSQQVHLDRAAATVLAIYFMT